MDFRMKLLQLTERENHLIVITRGLLDADEFRWIFRKVGETARSLLDCMILIDLEDAQLRLEPLDIHAIVDALEPDRWSHRHRIAMVSAPEIDKFDPLYILSAYLCGLGLKVAVFNETKSAASWLGDVI